MSIDWERGLFWLWLAGAVAWISPITFFVYEETRGFSLVSNADEWMSYIALWTIPPIFTFGIYLVVSSVGRRIAPEEESDSIP